MKQMAQPDAKAKAKAKKKASRCWREAKIMNFIFCGLKVFCGK